MNDQPTNVAAPGLDNNDLTDDALGRILTEMLHLIPDFRIELVATMISTISSRMLPGLRDELIDVLIDAVDQGAAIYDAEMAKRVIQ